MKLVAAFHEKLAERQQEETKPLWDEYLELLKRGEEATDADAERLIELSEALRITPEHVELHAMVLAEYRQLEQSLRDPSEVQQDLQAVVEKIGDLKTQINELYRQIAELEPKRDNLKGEVVQATTTETHLQVLQLRYPQLFGLDPEEAYIAPIIEHRPSPEPVRTRERTLGLPPGQQYTWPPKW